MEISLHEVNTSGFWLSNLSDSIILFQISLDELMKRTRETTIKSSDTQTESLTLRNNSKLYHGENKLIFNEMMTRSALC
jgi:hypothetical protein